MAFWRTIRRGAIERRTVLAILALALVVAVTGWRRLATEQGGAEPAPLPPGASLESDYSMTGFTLVLLGENGAPGFRLQGTEMRHNPQQQRSLVDRPRARVFSAPGTTWVATAESGWIADDSSLVRLEDSVVLEREAETLAPLTLRTDSLQLFPRREVARSDAEVNVEQPGASVSGRGLRANLARGHYQLNAEVKGRYEMPESPSAGD